jgi:hypothetical protein
LKPISAGKGFGTSIAVPAGREAGIQRNVQLDAFFTGIFPQEKKGGASMSDSYVIGLLLVMLVALIVDIFRLKRKGSGKGNSSPTIRKQQISWGF